MSVEIIVGNYRASNKASFLAYLDAVSDQRKDGGLFHGGHIHYIQNKLSDEDDFCFLKAEISMILDKVPSVFPFDWPEKVESGEKLGEKRAACLNEIQSKLILPMCLQDVTRVIRAAREYLELEEEKKQ